MGYPPEATFYARLSLMNPKAGEEGKVSQMMDDLPAHFSTVPGLVRGCRLLSGDPQDSCGTVAVWMSENDADQAATTQHVLSPRRRSPLRRPHPPPHPRTPARRRGFPA